jgi:predicted nucleic acid-binding protein
MPDTNCIVALLLPWHEHHARARAEAERRLDDGEVLVLTAHTLVETYAVLTRLPAPHRLLPDACRALLEANFTPETAEVVVLLGDDHRRLIHEAPENNLAGGHVYDAVIAACARVGRVDTLLTFNERHFAPFAGGGLAVVTPS